MKSILLLFALLIRIGEATNPGPPSVQGGLTLGMANPSGVLRKGSVFDDLPQRNLSVWGIAESHLTSTGIHRFKKELLHHKSQFSFHAGHPVPYRSQALTAAGGKPTGVGFLTNMPSKRLEFNDDHAMMATNRLAINTFRCGNQWVHGAIFYGYAQHTYSTEVKQRSDNILQAATSKLVHQMKGFRFIMGDFNQPNGSLTQTHVWSQLGWKEVQLVHEERTGEPVKPTCRGATTVDFIWVSPEMLEFLDHVEVIPDSVPDHSIVVAHFRPFFQPEPIHVWRKPKPFPWETEKIELKEHHFQPDGRAASDSQMIQIAEAFETRIADQLHSQDKQMLECQKGRSKTMDIIKQLPINKPLKPSRNGDIKPSFHGQSAMHIKWFTQLRRIVSLERHFAYQSGARKKGCMYRGNGGLSDEPQVVQVGSQHGGSP